MKKKLFLLILFAAFLDLPGFSQSIAYDSIDINNINARINSNGNLFWDLTDYAKFEVPKGSGKTSIFNNTLWIAGLDSVNTLHVAAERYNQVGHDYWSGPISNVYDSVYDAKWNKVWKIKKTDIDYHLAHCWQSGYVPAQVLINWPGNGDTTLGQAKITAPFHDWNNDGIYDPYSGDYPIIKGDEAVYFIFNDERNAHTESGGNKLGIEIHSMAYAFNCPSDSALWNTLFLNYKIINRSVNIYSNTYVGLFTDFDIGDATDDYIGCDVQRGSFYGYNGDDIDGTGHPQDYGKFPPAQSVTFLAGPYMDIEGIDNPDGLCDEGVNGFNFGNGIIDDERFGLSRFIYFNNSGQGAPWYSTDPNISADYYNYLQGNWKDSTQMLYGGNAHTGSGAYGPACHFMFPANSDTCNWGTSGIPPNGPQYWTEVTAGNQPDDRRGFGSSGPFTLLPNYLWFDNSQPFDIAFVFGRDYNDTNATAAITVMNQRIDSIRKYFINDSTPCGGSFSGIVKQTQNLPQLKIYPNPANDYITIEFNTMAGNINYEIFDIMGRKVDYGILKNSNKCLISVSNLRDGLYFLNITDGKNKFGKKFIRQ